jgi:hypothetical protein
MSRKTKVLILKSLSGNRPPITEVTSVSSGRSDDRGLNSISPSHTAANTDSNNVSFLPRRSDGTFDRAQAFPVGCRPYAVFVADFSGDNIPDLVTANAESNNVSILLGDGNGNFAPSLP